MVGIHRIFSGQHSRREHDADEDDVPEVAVVAELVAEDAESKRRERKSINSSWRNLAK